MALEALRNYATVVERNDLQLITGQIKAEIEEAWKKTQLNYDSTFAEEGRLLMDKISPGISGIRSEKNRRRKKFSRRVRNHSRVLYMVEPGQSGCLTKKWCS